MQRSRVIAAILALALSMAAYAQEEAPALDAGAGPERPAGHSSHGEAFNEGPRASAYLMGGTGKVDFQVTTKSPEAQAFFDQGVGQLHGFWYFEAERSFRQVAAIDPSCRMAYWGMAMANENNGRRAKGFVEKMLEVEGEVTPREQLWIDSIDRFHKDKPGKKERCQRLIKDLEEIIHEYPDDIEAKAFLVVRMWQFKRDLPIVSHEAVNSLLELIFAHEPMHPAHHYRIHLWDYERADRALRSAARCGQSSPSIAHMWHMPGHIFSRLERFADAAWQQEASARVDHAQMVRDRVLPDQIHNYAHNNEWLIRNLMNTGRVHDAIDLAKNMIELPRHPSYNTLSRNGRSASYGRERLFDVLERFHLWNRLLALSLTVYLEPTDMPREQARRLRARAVAYFELENDEQFRVELAALRALRDGLIAERDAAGEAAAEKVRLDAIGVKPEDLTSSEPIPESAPVLVAAPARTAALDAAADDPRIEEAASEARDAARRPFRGKIRAIERFIPEVEVYEAILDGETEKARESFGDIRDKTRRARAALRLGDDETAEKLIREATDNAEHRVYRLAERIDVLHRLGKVDDAKGALGKLREVSAHIDLDVPLFRNISPFAEEVAGAADWRIPRETPDDVGERPALDELGPFRWYPQSAPKWSLLTADGRMISLDDYRGRAVIVIFYLGFGCLHCVEQLETFGPRMDDFRRAGIELVAISTENRESLTSARKSYGEDGKSIPFPLVADPKLEVFKAYRAHDDFESQPLHGTFLIDDSGAVLWQDISYEPFTDADFVIEESKRLLRQRRVRGASF